MFRLEKSLNPFVCSIQSVRECMVPPPRPPSSGRSCSSPRRNSTFHNPEVCQLRCSDWKSKVIEFLNRNFLKYFIDFFMLKKNRLVVRSLEDTKGPKTKQKLPVI